MAMMATTIVALHLQGLRATVGHVGASRLYRLTPAGRLSRETEDHSLVEEEVRAGRMTPEQAAAHPGRNVISRALGAESSVEVDVRAFEVEAGTTFLLCSDGITRHIPDEELSELLRRAPSLKEACGEMKRICYERGAEDNLTAVLVRVGGGGAGAGEAPKGADAGEAPAARKSGGSGRAFGVLALVLALAGLAFYVGMVFERKGLTRMAGGAARMAAEASGQPLNSDDPEFLCLYGRALLLTDRQQDAAAAFDRAIQKINENMTPRNGELKIDARLAKIAAHLRAGDEQAARAAADDLAEVIRLQPDSANANTQPSPGVSP